MSLQHQQTYEKWRKAHDEECVRDLIPGAKVYRARYDRLQEGIVEKSNALDWKCDEVDGEISISEITTEEIEDL
jgi:hypothetical protein